MRALPGIEILTAADGNAAKSFADLPIREPKFRYLRLDRDPLPGVMDPAAFEADIDRGFHKMTDGGDVCLISSGYTIHRALEAQIQLAAAGISASVIDLFRIKPINFTDDISIKSVLCNICTV